MPYITVDYYKNDFMGYMPANPKELQKLIKRASDYIDILTNFKLKTNNVNFDKLATIIKENVMKATASLVEYYAVNGGYETFVQTQMDSMSAGNFSYSVKTSKGNDVDIPNNVINYLSVTGLLYAGVNTVGGGVYYDV